MARHATVNIGEYVIPLIGIPKTETEQQCFACRNTFHLSEIKLDEKGIPLCDHCSQLSMKRKKTKPRRGPSLLARVLARDKSLSLADLRASRNRATKEGDLKLAFALAAALKIRRKIK